MFRPASRRFELFDGVGVARRAKRRESHIWDSTIREWESAGAWAEKAGRKTSKLQFLSTRKPES